MKKCKINSCNMIHHALGFCSYHYSRDPIIKETINKRLRKNRMKTNNASTIKYEKTVNGFLMRIYRNMKSRITGVQKQKHYLYSGKSLIEKNEFYLWAKSSEKFSCLYEKWKNSGYNRKLTPTVDRINSSLGYESFNMEWVTHSENSRRGAVSRWSHP